MTHTCYNCERPTEDDYLVISFTIGADGTPVTLAFCEDCRARGAILATNPSPRPPGEQRPFDPEFFQEKILEKRPARVDLVVWLKLLLLFSKSLRDKEAVWYWDHEESHWTCGVVVDDSIPPDLWGAP